MAWKNLTEDIEEMFSILEVPEVQDIDDISPGTRFYSRQGAATAPPAPDRVRKGMLLTPAQKEERKKAANAAYYAQNKAAVLTKLHARRAAPEKPLQRMP